MALIRDMPGAGDVAKHVGSSSIQKPWPFAASLFIFVAVGFGFWLSVRDLLCIWFWTLCQGKLKNSFKCWCHSRKT